MCQYCILVHIKIDCFAAVYFVFDIIQFMHVQVISIIRPNVDHITIVSYMFQDSIS